MKKEGYIAAAEDRRTLCRSFFCSAMKALFGISIYMCAKQDFRAILLFDNYHNFFTGYVRIKGSGYET